MEKTFVPVRMVGVVTAEVGAPRNDGSPGATLYKIPIKIESSPPDDWSRLFVEAFNNPATRDSGHRPNIAYVSGDRIILNGTTMEELESTHLATLKAAVTQANTEYAAVLAARREMAEKKQKDDLAHKQNVDAAAKKMRFDD